MITLYLMLSKNKIFDNNSLQYQSICYNTKNDNKNIIVIVLQ